MGVTGTGETQLETDQRLVHTRIKNINQRLVNVRKQRRQNRRGRQKADIKTVSLVGYTNAGKSTLFNALCATDVHAADQLFATLDPTIRQLELPYLGKSILTDTVGFIRQLPHGLIDAFRATLEEVKQADLLLHVVDASSPEKILHHEEVNAVLTEIDADKVPQLLVYNKVDLTDEAPRVDLDEQGEPYRVWVSGLNGEGLELLLSAISARLSSEMTETTLKLPPGQGKFRAQLFELSAVVGESVDDEGRQCLQVRLEANSLRKLISQAGMQFSDLGIADSRDDQEPWMKDVANS